MKKILHFDPSQTHGILWEKSYFESSPGLGMTGIACQLTSLHFGNFAQDLLCGRYFRI